MKTLLFLFVLVMPTLVFSQTLAPDLAPGVSQDLARWRAARYSDVRYKLNLTLEKMSPVLKGTIEVRVKLSEPPASAGGQKDGETTPPGTQAPSPASPQRGEVPPIILDWRKIKGFEHLSRISKMSVNGEEIDIPEDNGSFIGTRGSPEPNRLAAYEINDHLVFYRSVVVGENVIKLDFTSPILPSGSAITRYVDKEDGAEYIYSLFVPSDASTAFPVFDQPDLKARFTLSITTPVDWNVISNYSIETSRRLYDIKDLAMTNAWGQEVHFLETKPISTYVFAFAAGPWEKVSAAQSVPPAVAGGLTRSQVNAGVTETRSDISGPSAGNVQPPATAGGTDSTAGPESFIYVRKSQAAKFKPHAAEVFRLNREAVKYFEEYFDYKFPFPKYDLVLIPEFPFGGMEHAGATFLREASIIFPQEPTKNDLVSRATLIFHEAAHQWFGDTVTMRWFDDLWLKEGFATFTAYKALEKIMPEMNAWKVFYERVKQAAYQTDSTRGTTAIYQPIANLSAAKSAYGNIVYNKAPAFLRQAEFYLGEDKFRAAVRSFLKRHEFGNAGWEDLVKEFERKKVTDVRRVRKDVKDFADIWVTRRGMKRIEISFGWDGSRADMPYELLQSSTTDFPGMDRLSMEFECLVIYADGMRGVEKVDLQWPISSIDIEHTLKKKPLAIIPNYRDYGYGIFLLDAKSREYVLKNILNEKDPFLRSMMWGALWDSVREGELDPRDYVELVVRVQSSNFSLSPRGKETSPGGGGQAKACTLNNCEDESTTALLLNRVGTVMNYYIDERPVVGGTPTAPVGARVEEMLMTGMQKSPTLGQRITYYRAFLNIASSEKARGVLKRMLASQPTTPSAETAATPPSIGGESRINGSDGKVKPPATAGGTDSGGAIPLKTKDKFDIVTRLLILNDPEAPGLLAELEKTETSDDAKRYAYAARAGIPTAENKAKYWKDFTENKEISESWIEAAFGPWNSIRHSELTLGYLERALKELPNHKRNRKIFFVNGWLGAFIGGQRSEEALAIVNKFLADNPGLDNDLRLKILENVDLIERAVNIRRKFPPV